MIFTTISTRLVKLGTAFSPISGHKSVSKMIYLGYLSVFLALVSILVYFGVVGFSHVPREPYEAETKYFTNDGTDKEYDLPSRINCGSTRDKHEIELSVVIPCYNETERLGSMLDECVQFLKSRYTGKYEILIVDDGSKDGTAQFALRKATELGLAPHILRVLQLTQNRGKGGAVTQGLLYSRGRLGLFADADGATSFQDVQKLIQFFDSLEAKEPGVAVGSRAHMVNTDAVVKRSFIRNFLMYGLHTLVFIFGIRDIHDTQCGFKMFNFEAIKNIFPHMHTERWIFDVEVLLLAELQNMKIKEIPVNWEEISGSKIDIARDSIEMAIDLVVTRLAYVLKIYKLNECNRFHKKTQ